MNASHTRFLETAERIGQRLCRDAVWAGSECNWLGWSMELVNNNWTRTYRAFGSDLYNGTAGIALFLTRLYAMTGDPIIRQTAAGAINQAANGIGRLPAEVRGGFYVGGAGIAYTLIETGTILEDESLVRRGIEELTGLHAIEPSDALTDLLSGSAGLIAPLIDIARRFTCDELMAIAMARGEQLLRLAQPTERGMEWRTMPVPEQGTLTGYSHGVSGIINAMLELHASTGDARYLDAALGGLRFERSHFDAEQGNWPDLRIVGEKPATPSFGMAWCHGAPGIGMARLRAYTLMGGNHEVLKEINAALATTANSLAYPVGQGQGNFSLCHGAAGNAELLLLAADLFDRADLRQIAENVGGFGIDNFEGAANPWPCGVLNGGETPNLMLGLAGIGYFYLRLHDSSAVPSVLLMEPR